MPLTKEQRLAFLAKARAKRSAMKAEGIKPKRHVKYGGMMQIDPSILDSMLVAKEQMVGNCRLVGSDSMVANLPLNTERGQEHFTKIPVPVVGAELQAPTMVSTAPQTDIIGENPGAYKIPPQAVDRQMSGYGDYSEKNIMGGPGYARFTPMQLPHVLASQSQVTVTKVGNGVRDGQLYSRSDQYAADKINAVPTRGIRASPGLSHGGQLGLMLDRIIQS